MKQLYAFLADRSLLAKGLWLALIPLTPLVITSTSIFVVQDAQRDAEAAIAEAKDVESELRELLDLLADAEGRQRAYLLTGDGDWLELVQAARRNAPAIVERLRGLVTDPQQTDRLTQLPALIQQRLEALEELAGEARLAGRFPAVVPATRIDRELRLTTEFRDLTRAMLTGQRAFLEARIERTRRMRRILVLVASAGAPAGLLGGLFVLVLFASGISSRVRVLNESADCLARGAPLPALPVGRDEIGTLGQHLHQAANLLAIREEELRRAHETVDCFFTLSLDLFCVAGFDGYFKRLNPAWPLTLGWTAEELLARPFADFVHPDDREATVREAEKLGEGAVTISFENRYRCRDGTFRWLQWMAVPVVESAVIYAVARDVTAAKEAETEKRRLALELEHQNVQLTALNRELAAFSYSVSHDLRAPLRSIDGFSQILLEDFADRLDVEGKDALQRVRAAATGMGELIDALLALSRLSRVELRTQHVNLSALAHTLLEEFRNSEPDRSAEFVIGPDMVVEGDPTLLKAALGNLFGNAWKYSRPRMRTHVEFGCAVSGFETVYFVRDNGVGFDMAYVNKLFGAFQRLHRQSEFGGTGVGLATVQRIIHRHGGRVWAESAVDQGATFYFTLHGPIAGDGGHVHAPATPVGVS